MKVRKEKLRSWLVIMRHVAICSPRLPFPLPEAAIHGLVANKWIECWRTSEHGVAMRLTEKGLAESDLCAADYGIDSLGEVLP